MVVMTEIIRQLDALFNRIKNKHELLVGDCDSGADLTSTQEHILMLLNQSQLTNRELAEKLVISAPAVTKALKKLQTEGLIASQKDDKDSRHTYWYLTPKAEPIAQEHAHHHEATLATYAEILSEFDADQQATISKFLSKLGENF
jgi:DNA-binding MarR family transcriptional regulator